MEKGPLSEIKVLELAGVLAGPSVGVALAELGALVIKVENLQTRGDVTRTWKLPTEDPQTDISGYFSCVNWGKKSLSINLRDPRGLDMVYRLAALSDVVLVSYKPRDAEKLKVDYPTLSHLNPRLIYGHITGYGLQNQRAGYDAIVQAESGFTYMNGEPQGHPTKMPVALMDILAGHQLKEAILLALWMRDRTGKGRHIEVSLMKSGVASLANQATNWLVGKTIAQRMGSDHPNIVPYGTIYYSRDKKPIVLAIGSDKQFADLCRILGRADLATDERYATNYARVRNREALNALLQDLVGKLDRDPFLEQLAQRSIPAGGVYNMKEVFEQPEARELVLTSKTTGGHPIEGVRTVAFTMDCQPPEETIMAPPHYGEHTREILTEMLKVTREQMEQLIADGVIYAKQSIQS